METVMAAFVIVLIVSAIIECGLQALRTEQRDYELTMVHSLCQESMEEAVFRANDPNQFDGLVSDTAPYTFAGSNNGNSRYWVSQRLVTTVNVGLKRVSVSIWQADPTTDTPTPRGRLLERLTTVVSRP